MLFTLKLYQGVPAERNRPDIIECCYQYAHIAQWYLEEAYLHHTVFIDECSFNLWTSRSEGRARREDIEPTGKSADQARNITICLAI